MSPECLGHFAFPASPHPTPPQSPVCWFVFSLGMTRGRECASSTSFTEKRAEVTCALIVVPAFDFCQGNSITFAASTPRRPHPPTPLLMWRQCRNTERPTPSTDVPARSAVVANEPDTTSVLGVPSSSSSPCSPEKPHQHEQ